MTEFSPDSTMRFGRHIPPDPSDSLYTTEHPSTCIISYGYDGLVCESPVFGAIPISPDTRQGQFLIDIMQTSLFQRAFGIGQLSALPGQAVTPNLDLFSTATGNLEQLAILRFIARTLRLSDEQMVAFMMAQVVTDATHGQLRHMTDVEIEGTMGRQKFHDEQRAITYAHGGYNDVCARYGIRLNADGLVPGIEIPPVVECHAPGINMDNFQYVLTEAYETFAGYHNHTDPAVARGTGQIIERIKYLARMRDVLEIDETGNFIFPNAEDALFFQKLQMLASTEDWQGVVNRVREHLVVQDLKYMKVKRLFPDMDEIDSGRMRRPSAYTLFVDDDVVQGQRTARQAGDEYLGVSYDLQRSMSDAERRRFVDHKLPHYVRFLLNNLDAEYPNELLWSDVNRFGLSSTAVDIVDVENIEPNTVPQTSTARLDIRSPQPRDGVTYVLPPFKSRVVRPFVRDTHSNRMYLDELDSELGRVSRSLLRVNEHLQWQQLTVRLVAKDSAATILRGAFVQTHEQYEALRRDPPLAPKEITRFIGRSAARAVVSAMKSGLLVVRQQ